MTSLISAVLILLTILLMKYNSLIMANSSTTFDTRSQSLFAGNLFSHIVDKKSTVNIVYSPASIHTCLALTYLGANGDTAKEIHKVLNLEQEDKTTFASKYGNFLKTVFNKNSRNDDEAPQLKLSTRLYVNNNIKILKQFNRLAQDSFGCEAENVDFSSAQKVVEKINKWVEEQTEKKIKSLLEKDAVNAETTSVLVNAIYFKAKWLRPFSVSSTHKNVFHINSKRQVEVDTMYTDDRFGYAELEDLDAKVLEMPYKNSDMSMLIILPNKIEGLKALENKLKGTNFHDISGKLVLQSVDVFLPKFRIEFNIGLKETLEKMGCASMFSSKANLTGIFDSASNQIISDVKHNAFLDCNEAGSEAAAATYIKIVPMSLNLDKKTFCADHPFVFIIRGKNAEYFAGHVSNF